MAVIPTLVAETGPAKTLLAGIAHRAEDLHPAWEGVLSDVLLTQRRWWGDNGGGTWGEPRQSTLDRDKRGDRSPRMMFVSGDLERAATERGAPGQQHEAGPDYLFLGIGGQLHYVLYQADQGREPIAKPEEHDVVRYAEHVAGFILTGATARG